MPLQKIAFPFHPTVAAVGYQQPPVATGPPPPNTHQQQHTAQTHHQTYQQHQMHQTALHQQLHHPAAAAAMFTPLSLRTFIPDTLSDIQCPRTFMGNRNHMNLSQQALTNVASLVATQHQQPLQATQQQTQVSSGSRHHQGSPIQATAHHQSHSAATIQSQTNNNHHTIQTHTNQSQLGAINLNMGCVPLRQSSVGNMSNSGAMMIPVQKV